MAAARQLQTFTSRREADIQAGRRDAAWGQLKQQAERMPTEAKAAGFEP
jgi:hypothetical protein